MPSVSRQNSPLSSALPEDLGVLRRSDALPTRSPSCPLSISLAFAHLLIPFDNTTHTRPDLVVFP